MVARRGLEQPPVGCIARAVQIQRDPDDLEVAEDLAVRLLLDLGDEPVDRLRDLWEVAPKPLTVESGDGIASYSFAPMVMTPVTWLTAPS